MGIRPANSAIIARLPPASFGEQGPGEITRAEGFFATASPTVIRSFRYTSGITPSSPKYCTRFIGEGIVIIEKKKHAGKLIAGDLPVKTSDSMTISPPWEFPEQPPLVRAIPKQGTFWGFGADFGLGKLKLMIDPSGNLLVMVTFW